MGQQKMSCEVDGKDDVSRVSPGLWWNMENKN